MSKENSFRFGVIQIRGVSYRMRDIVIFPDGTVKRRKLRSWFLSHHSIGKDEIDDLIAVGAAVIVIGTGSHSKLKVSETAMKYAAGRGVELVVLSSKDAVEKLNKYDTHDENMGAIVHLLC